MKYLILFAFLFIFGFSQAQTVKYSEDFETLPLSVTSTGNANWARSSTLQFGGSYSDSVTVTSTGTIANLTTDAFSTTGFNNVVLKFNHIAKIDLFDSCYIRVSVDNGSTWTVLNSTQYYGNGSLIGSDRFNSASYPNAWDASNNLSIPDNTWWRGETFDISAIADNKAQVKIQFVLQGSITTTYGWLLDDIEVTVSSGELIPPTIAVINPSPVGAVYGTGPFLVQANIWDTSGVASAAIAYVTMSGIDTIPMTHFSGNTYRGSIPSMAYGTQICYQVFAIDSSTNANKGANPANNCILFVPTLDPNAPTPFTYDVAMDTILNPQSVVLANTTMPIDIHIANKGSINLTSAKVDWQIDGVAQTTYNWAGSLSLDMVSTVLNLDSTSFTPGPHTLKVYTHTPNNTTDLNTANDTISMSLYACSTLLSGTYTLGGSSADFVDFADLMNALNNCGINGPTTIKVNPGTYNENVLFTDNIYGLSATNTLTIASSTNNPNDVKISYTRTANMDFVIGFKKAQWITLKNLTVEGLGSAGLYASAVLIDTASSNNTVDNCIVMAPYTNSGQTSAIFIRGLGTDDNTITNSSTIGGVSGIRLDGNYQDFVSGNKLINNNISGFYSNGVYAYYCDQLVVHKNKVSRVLDNSNNTTMRGLYFSQGSSSVVTENILDLNVIGACYATYFSNYIGVTGAEAPIANNMISISGNSTSSAVYGIYVASGSYLDLIYNSVGVYTGSTSFSNALYYTGSSTSNNNVNNNIFAHFGGGLALRFTSGGFTSMDYNAYYTTGIVLAKGSGTASTSVSQGITGLQSFTGHDTNSVMVDPKFYSPSNLHSFGASINGIAKPISYITTDIDGDVRNSSNPDIGADEFTISTMDVGVASIINPLPVDTQSNVTDLKVMVMNYGSNVVTSMNVKYSLNGGSIVNYAWTGSIAAGISDTVNLGSITLPYGNYTIKAFTELTGDTLNYNDTLLSTLFAVPLIDLQAVGMPMPMDGCGKGNTEVVQISIKNNGVGYAYNGVTASYQVVGSSTIVTENVTDTIGPGATILHTFSQTTDMTATLQDSTYQFKLSAYHMNDLNHSNDTTIISAIALANLPDPIVSDTTINYGTSVQLTAISSNLIKWYENDTITTSLGSGVYTTPKLFDTTTYYAQSSGFIPAQTGIIGSATTTFTGFDYAMYGGGMGSGKYQMIYTASELIAAGVTAGNIESIAFNVAYSFGAPTSTEIYMATTNAASLGSTFLTPSFILVYSGSFTGVAGWNTHTFSTPYYWDGVSNVLIQFCTQGISYQAPPVYYTNTLDDTYLPVGGVGTSCATTTGNTWASHKMRPNIKIITQGQLGCSSVRVPLVVTAPFPAIDASVVAIVNPKDDCGLASTPVTIDIVGMGSDTIYGGFTAKYRVNNGPYITPETITDTIMSGDTLRYTFNTLASLAPGANGTKYKIEAIVTVPSDAYTANDSLESDSILSKYTPTTPIVSNITINYADSAVLAASSSDSVFWYTDPQATMLLGMGSTYTTQPIFDTTTFYAVSQRTIMNTTYDAGTGTSVSSTQGPSPYGAGSYGARVQFLITAAELNALGMIQGSIDAIAFDVSNVIGVPLQNYTLKIGQTAVNNLSGNYFESGLTTVYTSNGYTDHVSWNTHPFSAPFYWDGVSNIVIETCFKNNATVAFSGVRYTTTPFASVGYSKGYANFYCTDSSMNFSSFNRPNIRLSQTGQGLCRSDIIPMDVNVINYITTDAGLSTFTEPVGSASSNTPSLVKVVLKNHGLNTMTAATINWTENGYPQSAYSWSGSLVHGATDTVTIATAHTFMGGVTKLKAWVSLTNDTIHTNDTITSNIVVCMSGAYTINASTGDYASFTHAINDLNIAGICGPVVFNVDSGVYNEQVVIYAIQGSSSTNTVTFQSTQMDSSKVTVQFSTLQNTNYIIQIDGASHIKIKHLTISSNGGQYGNNVVLNNGAHHIEILNNRLISSSTLANQSIASAVYTKAQGVDHVNISNNVITNGYSAILLEGVTADSINDYVIVNNIMNGFTKYALQARYINDINFTDNEMTSSTLNTQTYGVYMYRNEGFLFKNNKMILGSTGTNYGYYISYCVGTASNHGEISNNFVSITYGTGTKNGIYITANQYVDVIYNSINIVDGSATSRGVYLSGGSYIMIKNNSIATAKGHALYTTSIPGFTTVDYNNYYVDPITSSSFVRWSSELADLAALKAFDPNNHQHCISSIPEYMSTTDLHSQQIDMYNAAIPFAGITTDIDGESRSTTAPSIGADEFTPPSIDMGILGMPYPVETDCGYSATDSIVIKVKNFGINNVNFATSNTTIKVYIGSSVVDTITYVINSGILNSGVDTMIVVSNNFDLSINGSYTFQANISIANDGNSGNDDMSLVSIISLPNINTFPFNEDFESGYDITFKEADAAESDVAVASSAANNSSYGLHFQGGTYSSWTNKTTVEDIFNSNSLHTATAKTCNVDATNNVALSLQFDLRQTHYSSTVANTSWFRVLLLDANNNTHYLKNINGDSVFQPQTTNADPFTRHTFELNQYVGQNFQISFEAVNKYVYGYGSFEGDNAFIDNISIWEPAAIDVGMKRIISHAYHGKANDAFDVEIAFMNMGTDTLYSAPLAYQVDNGLVVRDTAYGIFVPAVTDTFLFSTPHIITVGLQNVCVFAEVVGDALAINDTICGDIMGMKTYTVNYMDHFEIKNDWFGEGNLSQWQLGTPSTSNINAAHSGQNAWVTMLSSDYQSGSVEYLYTPYLIIPTYADTADLEFWMFMDVNVPNAYGQLEYSFDGINWAAYGYKGDPNSTNWYNQNLGGKHVWSKTNSGWSLTSTKLDPSIFNNGTAFQLRFTFNSGTSSITAEGWAIDDFKITTPAYSKDAGINALVTPMNSTVTGDSIMVSVSLKNFGSDTLFATPISYSVDGVVISTINWSGMLLQDSVEVVNFSTKYYAPGNDYKFCAYTSLNGDLQNMNDTLCSYIVANPGALDAGTTTITSPLTQTIVGQPTTVAIMIRNFGTDPLTSIPVEYFLNGIKKANEIFTGNLAANDSALYTFTTTYVSGAGNYALCARTQLPNDVDTTNNGTCVTLLGTVGINGATDDQFVVAQNQPNPLVHSTEIEFYLPKTGKVQFKVVNMLGEVLENQESNYAQGKQSIMLYGQNYSAGVYYYSVSFDGITKTYKMIVVK